MNVNKKPFIKKDAGNVEYNAQVFNNSTALAEAEDDEYVYTYCDGCGKRNRVKVVFKDYKSPFNDT